MIDIHNHLLFGLDDGCKTLDETMIMISKAATVGVKEIIFTPHFGPMRGFVKTKEEVTKVFELVKKEVENKGIEIKLHLGREIDEVDNIVELLKEGSLETLADTKYVLLDFGMKKTEIDDFIYELIIAGYKPIIAHPERYSYVKDYREFHKWKKTGAYLQINASSIFRPQNKETKKKTAYLLKNGLIDFVASDAHRNEENYDDFIKAINKIDKKHPNNKLLFSSVLGGVKSDESI